MKLTAKQITTTAILLAISIASQFFKNASVYITGPVINACLILTVLSAGIVCGVILSVITPVTAFLIAGSPIMAAIPAIIPCIMIGNMILVLGVGLFVKKIKGKGGLITGMAAGSLCKALFMGIVISLILIPNLIPAAMEAKMGIFQMTFSVTQLITALIGSVYALILWIPLKKVMAEENQGS
ncbi:MAG: ECF transporter S component [Lachnospiraceae bacterium]|nr:ECF transporter S component [Lachnospiraceae bacterium]